jgi:hypothetical protein
MKIIAAIALIALASGVASGRAMADEPVGCDKFKWPLDKERATLTGTDLPKVASGAHISWPLPWAATIGLVPLAEAKLPTAPERAPKTPDTYAGFVAAAAPKQPGTYRVTLSSAGWIDLVQDGHTVKSSDFSGATGCDGVRKSVKFNLTAQPFVIELTSVPADTIGIAVSGD